MISAKRANLERLLAPKNIAFVGGEEAASAIEQCRHAGYSGAIWGVHPKRKTLGECPCFPNVSQLPEAPDATFLAIPRDKVVGVVNEIATIGGGGVVCYTAGFRELGGLGIDLEIELVKAAQDLALVGPNVFGLLNYVEGAHLWPYSHGGSRTTKGPAIISQSGMLSSSLTFNNRSVSFSYVIGAGNQASLGIEDYIEVLVHDPAVTAIGLYIEALQDIKRFSDIALTALKMNIPIVALKVGQSEIAANSTVSHTGSLSGDEEKYKILFSRLGIITVRTPAMMLETLKLLTVSGAPRGQKLAAFTCSGGDVAMLADCADTIGGIDLPKPKDSVKSMLADKLPPIATISNPLDYTTPLWGQEEALTDVFSTALEGDYHTTLLVQDYPPTKFSDDRRLYLADARAFISASQKIGIPAVVCSSLPENMDTEIQTFFIQNGVTPLQGIEEAITAISGAAQFGCKYATSLTGVTPIEMNPPGIDAQSIRNHDEWISKSWLRELGFKVPDGALITPDSAIDVASSLGFPLALKLVSTNIMHKTEIGGVILDIANDAELHSAIEALSMLPVAIESRKLLLEEMITPVIAEILVNVSNDPDFGHILTLGSGGIFVELLKDTKSLLLPASREEITEALAQLKVSQLLSGYRNRERTNIEPIIDLIVSIAKAAERLGSSFEELELNPVIISNNGPVIADAVLRACLG
ncbi:MAG: acyl-CoA synthetase [Acidiferrobacteraceae bacterium]|nr:acyl-CoA synthetase [Acidiferrobacteraceae bacterium]